MILSPSYYYSVTNNNNIPFYTPGDTNTNTNVNAQSVIQGLDGTAVSISNDIPSDDVFNGCATYGATYLENMSSYLLSSSSLTFGAITMSNETDDNNLVYNIMINASAVHGTGIYTNIVNNGYFKAITNDDSATITTHNYPLPLTNKQKAEAAGTIIIIITIIIITSSSSSS